MQNYSDMVAQHGVMPPQLLKQSSYSAYTSLSQIYHNFDAPTAQSQPTPENSAHVAREIAAACSSSEVLGRVQAVRIDHKVPVGHVAVGDNGGSRIIL